MISRLAAAEYVAGYTVWLRFDDGLEGETAACRYRSCDHPTIPSAAVRNVTATGHRAPFLAYSTLKLTFVEAPLFSKLLCKYMDDEGYRRLQLALLAQPEKGDLIPGTGGFRKLRFVRTRSLT